jgi:hypothetical protein
MWIIIGLIVVGIAALLLVSRGSNREEDMGTVSGQWLAEHRQAHES